MKDKIIKRFYNAQVLLDHHIEEGELWVAGGKIISPQTRADQEIDVSHKILAPGFIDVQINGCFGCDFSRNPEKIAFAAKKLLQYGVTSFLPTVVSSTPEQYRQVIPLLQPREFDNEGASILGIHLEGPFFATAYRGAHNPQYQLSFFNGMPESVYGELAGVKIVTLAPEITGSVDLIHLLKERGILAAAGHSAATAQQMRTGIEAGVGLATHLFNAMAPFHHRSPGIIGSALIDPKLPYSLIVDGVHLCPEAVALCWSCNPKGLILISDATEALGLPDGYYKLGTLDTELKEDRIYLAGTHTIAGSNLSLDKAVRLLCFFTHCSKAEALEAASLKPAKLIHAFPERGTLAVGARADFIILSGDLEVEATFLNGELAWSKE